MENKAAFDMNLMVRRWRDQLSQSPSLSRESLDELESHLRDSVTALEKGGLTTEEAFLIASRRLGPGSSLEMEFAKVTPTQPPRRNLAVWAYLGIALVVLTYAYFFVMLWPLTAGGLDADYQAPPPGTSPLPEQLR